MEGSQEENSQEAEREQITLVGRVGAAAKFERTQDKRNRNIRFPLVVYGPDDSTDWHSLVMPEEIMKGLTGILSKGDKIEVVGEMREGIKNGPRGGKPRMVKEFHASQIKIVR